MNAVLNISQSELNQVVTNLEARFAAARQPVQEAMADMVYNITRSNIGNIGLDRPIVWPPLSPAYARKVGRLHATLFVSGRLEASIRKDGGSPEEAVVAAGAGVPYAFVHQYGGGNNIPARPYIPFYNGVPTPFTVRQVKEAAVEKLNEVL